MHSTPCMQIWPGSAQASSHLIPHEATLQVSRWCLIMLWGLQKYPLPGVEAENAEQAILDEFDDAREVVQSLSAEYKDCEKETYTDRVTTLAAESMEYDRRIPAN